MDASLVTTINYLLIVQVRIIYYSRRGCTHQAVSVCCRWGPSPIPIKIFLMHLALDSRQRCYFGTSHGAPEVIMTPNKNSSFSIGLKRSRQR